MIYARIKQIIKDKGLNIEKCMSDIRENSKIYTNDIYSKIDSLMLQLNGSDLINFIKELNYINTIYLNNIVHEKDYSLIQQDVLMTIDLYSR